MSLTDNGEVERGLSEAKAVPQLDGVTATVFLLTADDGEFTAAVCAFYGDVTRALLDLTTHTHTHTHNITQRDPQLYMLNNLSLSLLYF